MAGVGELAIVVAIAAGAAWFLFRAVAGGTNVSPARSLLNRNGYARISTEEVEPCFPGRTSRFRQPLGRRDEGPPAELVKYTEGEHGPWTMARATSLGLEVVEWPRVCQWTGCRGLLATPPPPAGHPATRKKKPAKKTKKR